VGLSRMVGDEAEKFPSMARIDEGGEGWGFMHARLVLLGNYLRWRKIVGRAVESDLLKA